MTNKKIPTLVKCILICSLLLQDTSGLADAAHANHYVWKNSPTPGEPYHAWTNAAHDIQTAVTFASIGDTVWVTNGVYVNTTNAITVEKNITLKSVNGAEFTVIDGNFPSLTNRCLMAISSSSSGRLIVDGFTITNGGLSGVWMVRSSLLNSIVTGNSSPSDRGGGIYMGNRNNGQPGGIVSNCVVYGNTSSSGGGIYMFSNANVYGPNLLCFSRIEGNTASYIGGGINTYMPKNGSNLIENCQITGNRAQSGGGLYCTVLTAEDINMTVRNCLIASNSATIGTSAVQGDGGGIKIVNHPAYTIENCTIVMNTARKNAAGLYYSTPSGTGTVENTIIDLNIAPASPSVDAVAGLLTFTNCSLQSMADVMNNTNCLANAQCLFEVDTRFVDSASGNYRLRPSSPCVNAGINRSWMSDALDLDNEPRIQNDIVDMGAYETLLKLGTWMMIR